jgi:hypothetical protein
MIERIKQFDRWLSIPKMGPGEPFDPSTLRGCIWNLLLSISIAAALWFFDEIYSFLSNFFGTPFEINRAKQSWHQTWALIIGLPYIFWSVFALIMLPINRRRAVESAKGQWFDQDGQTRSDALHPKCNSELDGTRVNEGDRNATTTHKKP